MITKDYLTCLFLIGSEQIDKIGGSFAIESISCEWYKLVILFDSEDFAVDTPILWPSVDQLTGADR